MFPGYVWNDVGNEVGRIGNYRTPHSPHSERRINWSKRGPKWDLAQEVKYSNLFSFLPCSVSWSVFLFPRGNHSPVSSPDCLNLRGWHWSVLHCRDWFPSSHSALHWCLNNAMVTLMWLDMGNWARNATSYWQHWTKIHTSKHQRHSFV